MSQSGSFRPGIIVMLLGSLAGLAVALYAYFTPLTGVNGSLGALVVILSTIALAILTLVLAPLSRRSGRVALRVPILLDLVGTPFYRLIALAPGTGEEKWSFDTQSSRKALTQPVLKNRGVSYWEAENPVAGEPCQKIVYIGTMDAQLFALDADTGELCKGFADNGVLNVNQWNDTHAKWPLSVLQPPTVVGDHLMLGWAGMDWAYEQAPLGTVFSLDARTGELEWTFQALSEEMRKKSGTANVWTHMSADRENGLLYLPVSSPSPNYWGGNRTAEGRALRPAPGSRDELAGHAVRGTAVRRVGSAGHAHR